MRRFIENGQEIVAYSPEELAMLPSESDWEKVAALTDAEISLAVQADPDTPPCDSDTAQTLPLGRGRAALRQTGFPCDEMGDYGCTIQPKRAASR